jgi:UDP-glucose 4-epimerase
MEVNNKINVLITGGAGFIGSHVTREMLNYEGFHPVVLDDLSGGYMDNVPEGATFVKGSITDVELIKALFAQYKFKYVYHLAAYAAEGLSHFIRRFNYTNNLIGSVNLINESVVHGVECFVFTSSIAVYGPGQVPMIESMTPEPEDPYGIAKFAVELDLQNAKRMFGLNSVVFRPHNVYGEYQNIGDRYRNVVGIFMNQVMRGEPLTIFGDGEQQRAFSYVGDIVGPIVTSAWNSKAYGEVFNIGADVPFTVNDLSREILNLLNAPNHPIIHAEARNEVQIAYSDHSKVKSIFQNVQSTELSVGLKRMIDWVNIVGSRESGIFENIEITKNLPPIWRVNQ